MAFIHKHRRNDVPDLTIYVSPCPTLDDAVRTGSIYLTGSCECFRRFMRHCFENNIGIWEDEWARRGNGDLYYYDSFDSVSCHEGDHHYELDTDYGEPLEKDEHDIDLDILYDIEWMNVDDLCGSFLQYKCDDDDNNNDGGDNKCNDKNDDDNKCDGNTMIVIRIKVYRVIIRLPMLNLKIVTSLI